MIGGRFLTYRAMWATIVEVAFFFLSYGFFLRAGLPFRTIILNLVLSLAFALGLLANGFLRMFFTSRRLSIVRRVVMIFTWWIPVVNLFVLGYVCRLVSDEYDYALYKADLRNARPSSDLCQTKYPLLMVHGVLFRDLKYFNYWGRIPKELIGLGATVYYGNQEAVGTIASNGEDIKKAILLAMEETGCDKVNIIAHSKGGLDARYAISSLGMDQHVASLTTVCTPHRGCKFVDLACRYLPEKIYRLLARYVDNTFRKFGDESPDFYTATHQFSTASSEEFNQNTPDSPLVYYQSYATKMRHAFSDTLLSIPYLIIRAVDGENDGLVAVESAQWGNFRGLLTSRGRRGISHGDIIDLKREDYRGFDVIEAYVDLVADLKSKGY